jgi:putative ABC transport system permease protein
MIVTGLRSARARMSGLIAVFVVLTTGAAALMVCASVAEAGAQDRVTAVRLAAADAVVVAAQGYPAAGEAYPEKVRLPIADVQRSANVPGVARAVGDVSVAARAPGYGDGEWMMHGWGSAPFGGYRLVTGLAPSALDELATGTGSARVGERITLLVGGRPRRFTVTGLVATSTAAPAGTASTASRAGFLTEAEARSLAGDPGRVDAILIAAQPGIPAGQLSRRLAAALASQRIDVLTGAQRGRAEQPVGQAGSGLLPLGAVTGGLCGMLTAIVAAGTIGLSLRQRAMELALLRVIGASPGRLRRAVIGEIGLLAVAAGAAGVLLFRLFDAAVFARLTSAGLAPVGLRWSAGVFPIVVGAVGVLLVAVVSAWVAAFGPSRVPPMRALGAARRERRTLSVPRLVAALVCLTGGIVLAVATARWARGEAAAATAALAALVWAGFFAAVSPLACRLVAAVVRVVPAGPGRWLAVRNLGARPAELGAGPATAGLLVVGLGCAFVLLPWNQTSARRVVARESVHADAVLSFDPGVSASELGRLAGQPGVARLAGIRVTAGSLADLADGTIALPASHAPSRQVGHRWSQCTSAMAGWSGCGSSLRSPAVPDTQLRSPP